MKKLKELISSEGFTVEEIANKLGVLSSTVIEWEKEDVYPSIPDIVALANVFGVLHQDLLCDGEDYPRLKLDSTPVVDRVEVAKDTLHSLAISYSNGILANPFSGTYMRQKAEDIYDAIRLSMAITDIFTRLSSKLHSDETLWRSLLSLKPNLQDDDSNYAIWGIDLFYNKGLIQMNELNLVINLTNEFISKKTNNPIYTSFGAIMTMSSVFNVGLRLVEMEAPSEVNAMIACHGLTSMILSPIGITTSKPEEEFDVDLSLFMNAPISYITNFEFLKQ